MNEQKEYTKFYEETSPDQLAIYDCKGHVDIGEQILIRDKIKPKAILDVGCGRGRLFEYFTSLGIDFMGIEKSKNWGINSTYQDKIIIKDISNPQLICDLKSNPFNLNLLNYDLIALFGGTIHGFIDPILRKQAWYNISCLVNESNSLLISSLCDYEWFELDNCGKAMRLLDQLPFQYFYSKKELESIFSDMNLSIIDTLEFPNPLYKFEKMKHIYYILKQK